MLHILVVDFETLACEETSAFGFSPKGCRIKSDRIRDPGKTIGLRIAGFDRIIKGRVAEILREDVLVAFDFTDESKVEKRRERRRKVSIHAWVSGQNASDGLRCEIVDASQSGCRLSGGMLHTLPDDVSLQIPGLDAPVSGRIVWRANDFAGVKLLWRFSNGNDFKQERLKPPSLAAKAGAAVPERNNGSGFGVKRKKDTG